MRRELDLQILFRFTWRNPTSVVSREVNDGRGPVDYLVSRSPGDKTAVEFKLASNSQLKRNLLKQVEIYQLASDAGRSIKVVLYFTDAERDRVRKILDELDMIAHPDIVLIDARPEKPSGSRA